MLIKNSIICKNCFTQIISRHGHDYVTCKCGEVSLDGGLNYQKIRAEKDGYIDATICSNDSHEKIRVNFEWGSYGKGGDQPLQIYKLCDMNQAHIGAILETQKLTDELRKIFVDEINFRNA
jgi:hypothetical protein